MSFRFDWEKCSLQVKLLIGRILGPDHSCLERHIQIYPENKDERWDVVVRKSRKCVSLVKSVCELDSERDYENLAVELMDFPEEAIDILIAKSSNQ
jgi:hypothetical protein